MNYRLTTYIFLGLFIVATLILVAIDKVEDLHGASMIIAIAVGYFVEKKWKKK